MNLTLNGKQIQTTMENLNDLISELKYNSDKIIIEHNRNIVNKRDWKNQNLKTNDRIEIISFVGGG